MGTNLLDLIGRDVPLAKAASTYGGEYCGPCPWCGGQEKRRGRGRACGSSRSDRFHVWPARGRYWCRRCNRSGDAIQYLRERHGLSFREAREQLGLPHSGPPRATREPTLAQPACEAPADLWQLAGLATCVTCEEQLWSEAGRRALDWLRGRALMDRTIRAAGLGYNPAERWDLPGGWGLPRDHKRVWIPRGIVIPWLISGELWRVNVRRPAGEPKYVGPAGWGVGLYGVDALKPGWPAVLAEGEIDALTVRQHAGDVAAAVATGSAAGGRRARWVARLAACSTVLVAFDADEAGEKAAGWWLNVLRNAKRWRPYYGKDANGLAQAGGDVREWILTGLGRPVPAARIG